MPDDLLAQLESEAKARRVTKSWLVRESLEALLRKKSRAGAVSCYDLARDLAGTVKGLPEAGPLIGFLASGLRHHLWTVEQWRRLCPPLLTCEPVLTEAAFLLKREGRDVDALFALLERGAIRIALAVQ